LQTLDEQEAILNADLELAKEGLRDDRNWYVTPHGHLMTIILGPVEFTMGTDPELLSVNERLTDDGEHPMRIGRSWAISTIETSQPQFKKFRPSQTVHPVLNPDPTAAQTSLQWYDAAKYCRWLSEQEAVEEDQMCYPALDQIKSGMKYPKSYLTRTGYRLPSELDSSSP